jgi:3-oxoacyl-[acyl-carrier-protein] synthase-3
VGSVGILGYGYYLPELIMTNHELAIRFGKTENWIEERTGIKERRIAKYNTATSDLAIKAALAAIEKANLLPEDIDLIIVATTTPDMIFPSTACLVQNGIGACNAAAFDISAACTGFIYGLDTAVSYVSSGQYNNVLLVGADTYSKITNHNDINTSILFGDGAGAVVVGKVPEGFGVLGSIMGADGSGADLLKVPAGGSRQPLTHGLLDNRLNTIVMNGREVFQFAIRIFENMINQIIDKTRLTMEDISLIIPHQANKRILAAVSEKLKIPPEKMYCNIEYYGNMSSASIPVALSEACNNDKIKKGDILLFVGFGAGLTWGTSLIKWYDR